MSYLLLKGKTIDINSTLYVEVQNDKKDKYDEAIFANGKYKTLKLYPKNEKTLLNFVLTSSKNPDIHKQCYPLIYLVGIWVDAGPGDRPRQNFARQLPVHF